MLLPRMVLLLPVCLSISTVKRIAFNKALQQDLNLWSYCASVWHLTLYKGRKNITKTKYYKYFLKNPFDTLHLKVPLSVGLFEERKYRSNIRLMLPGNMWLTLWHEWCFCRRCISEPGLGWFHTHRPSKLSLQWLWSIKCVSSGGLYQSWWDTLVDSYWSLEY